MVALNESAKEIAFFECKWSSVSKKTPRESSPISSSRQSSCNGITLSERSVMVIAKRLAGKEELRSAGYLAYDLDGLERQLK